MTEINPTDVPSAKGGTGLSLLWLAFCSGNHFNSIQGGLTRPVWPVLDDVKLSSDYFVKCSSKSLDGHPNLMQSIEYLSDGKVYELTGDRTSWEIAERFQYEAPFDEGFVRASYEVLETTNTANLLLPKRFVLKNFGPQLGGSNTNDLRFLYQYEGTLALVREREDTDDMLPATEAFAACCFRNVCVLGRYLHFI